MDQNNSSFNLADIAEVLNRRKKFIIIFCLSSVVISAAIVFFVMPPYYKSTTVVVAANPALADKARLYNDNVEHLYSTFGSEDDLNRLYGIADLDTTYKLLVKKFDLVKYYKIAERDDALNQRKAIKALKEDVELVKNELYQLKISVTTKDKQLSASIANHIADIIQLMAQGIWRKTNEKTIDEIAASSEGLERQYRMLADSTGKNAELLQVKKKTILEQLEQNEKLISQFKVSLANNAPALMILEQAYPSAKADKPRKLLVISAALLVALAFSIMMVLVFERRQ